MTMLGSAVIVGQAGASVLTGTLADRFGTGAALVVPVVAATLVLLAGVANWVLSPAPAQSHSTRMVTPPLANAGTSA
jgi:MFS family permease